MPASPSANDSLPRQVWRNGGADGWRWRELGLFRALHYLLVADPPEFTAQYVTVGAGCAIDAPAGGAAMLWCFANDARKFYGNNTGSVLLEVERVA